MIILALYHSVRVPVPDSKIFRRKQNDSVYIYYYIDFFRKENGNPSNKSKNIGKLDKDSNMLIPNDNYYKYFDHSQDTSIQSNVDQPEPVFEGDFSIGYSTVINHIFSDLGVDEILRNNFGYIYRDIISVAAYSIIEGSTMSYIDDYMSYHYDYNNTHILINQRISELFQSITYEQRYGFFADWVEYRRANGCYVYDVTSISTYSNGIVQAEFGYNRDHDDLKQINIGLFSDVNTKLPVYYENYNGSLTDKANLIPVLENAKSVGIDNVHVIMDGGFFDEKRIKELDSSGLTFTVGMPSSLDKSKDLLKEHRNEIHTLENLMVSYDGNYAKMYDAEIYGIKGRVMIGLNTTTQELMLTTLKNDILKREKELRDKKYKKYSTVIKKTRYTDLFDIFEDEEQGYTYHEKTKENQEKASNYGYFLVFTTDKEASAEDILYYYREKDIDEKMFYQLKNYMEFKRMRTHNQQTTDGKIFTLFIGLIARNYMQQKLQEYMNNNHLTLEKCIKKLEDIKIIKIKNQSPRLIKALTKQQKELLDIFGVDINKTLEKIEKSF